MKAYSVYFMINEQSVHIRTVDYTSPYMAYHSQLIDLYLFWLCVFFFSLFEYLLFFYFSLVFWFFFHVHKYDECMYFSIVWSSNSILLFYNVILHVSLHLNIKLPKRLHFCLFHFIIFANGFGYKCVRLPCFFLLSISFLQFIVTT